jgi:hypothetical protein
MKLTTLQQPFICGVVWEATPDAAIADIKRGEYDGANAFEFNIGALLPEHRTRAAIVPVLRSTARPILTTYRRYGGIATGKLEPLDIEDALVSEGSAGFDMELDAFDPRPGPSMQTQAGLRYASDRRSPPREISYDPKAVDRQRALIERAHAAGGEVLSSAHVLTRIDADQAVQIAALAAGRGADMVKIVRFNQDWHDTLETLEATIALREAATIPFVMMAMGEYGKLTRLTAPMFGSMLCFCRQYYAPGSFTDQPLIRAAKLVFENTDFSITARAAEFLAANEINS